MLTNLTSADRSRFFRDKTAFANIAKILEHKIQSHRAGPCDLALWSSGCGSGQEAYSLALLCEQLRSAGLKFNYFVYASDDSAAAIAEACQGCYGDDEVKTDLSPTLLQAWFDKKQDKDAKISWQVKAKLQAKVKFEQLDLQLAVRRPQAFDLVFCSQVLAKVPLAAKERLLTYLGQCLKVDGYLVLGPKESLRTCDTEFYPVTCGKSTFYQYDRSLPLAEALHQETAS